LVFKNTGSGINTKKNKGFIERLGFALRGLRLAIGQEKSLRTQLVFFVAVLGVLAWLRPAPVWWALVGLAAGLVISAELLNSALERLADRIQPGLDDEIRVIKDIAAAGVLVTAITAAWIAVFLLLAYL